MNIPQFQQSATDAVHSPIKSRDCIKHLEGRELCIRRRNGTVQNFWQLDLNYKELVPLRDYSGNITDYGVFLWAYMNSAYPHKLKVRSISELLELNP